MTGPALGTARAAPRGARRSSWRGARGDRTSRRLAGGIGVSALLHVVAVVALVLHRGAPTPPAPPVYRVDLVAAPPGPRSVGEVRPEPTAPTPPAPTPMPAPTPAPTPPRAAPPPPKPKPLPAKAKAKPAPPKAPTKATPVLPPPKAKPGEKTATPPKPTAPAPRAGGGPEGGQGADVANVHVKGLDFPFPGYLQNIVRQVAREFTPPRGSALTADVTFLIHRDGSVSDVRIVKRSGSYAFDLQAHGAIEAASPRFGALPTEFRDDVLPVTFSFDPRIIH